MYLLFFNKLFSITLEASYQLLILSVLNIYQMFTNLIITYHIEQYLSV